MGTTTYTYAIAGRLTQAAITGGSNPAVTATEDPSLSFAAYCGVHSNGVADQSQPSSKSGPARRSNIGHANYRRTIARRK